MKLFSGAALLGNSAKRYEDQRLQKVAAIADSGTVKFAKTIGDSAYEKITLLEGLPNVYLEYPADIKLQNVINDAAVRVVQIQEHEQILKDSIVYFAVLDNVFGKSPNYMLATSKGIFVNGILRKFIPSDNIAKISLGKDNISINEKEGRYICLTVTTIKKVRGVNPQVYDAMLKLYETEM